MKQGALTRRLILILFLVSVLAVAGIVGVVLNSNRKQLEMSKTNKVEKFQFYETKYKELSNAEDTGVMIMDCDNPSSFTTLSNAFITHKPGNYVQGTGALQIGSIVNRGGIKATVAKFNNVDISEYQNGSIHFSIYINDMEKMSDRTFSIEITSSGIYDKEEMCWNISPTILQNGWNDVYLSIDEAIVNKDKGTPNFANINYCRILAGGAKSGIVFAIDNVYATNTEGSSLENVDKLKRASSKGKYFMDCDSLDGLAIEDSENYSALVITNAKGDYKEGTGALGVVSPKSTWVEAQLKPMDISKYSEGILSFWLYIPDVSYVDKGKFVLELSSAGRFDKNEISWSYKGAELQQGWNKIEFIMAQANKTSKEPIDLAKVNYLRIYGTGFQKGLSVILDAFKISDVETIVPKDGVLLNCDNQKRMQVKSHSTFSVTNTVGEFKEGTGAFKSVGPGPEFFRIGFFEKYDISNYRDGGLQLWLYVDDVSKLGDVLSLELGSGGKPDVNEYQWQIQTAQLENGWNELTLEFNRAYKLGGKIDLSKINCMRLFASKCKDNVTVILDDVRAIHIKKEIIVPKDGVLLNCDKVNRLTVSSDGTFSITRKSGEFKEGTGAYKCVGTNDRLFQITFRDYYDLYAYKDGAIQMWLYIDDVTKLGPVLSVELGSGGKPDVNEYQWQVNSAGLKNGWNQLVLRFSKALKLGGTPDISRLNAMRLFSSKCTGKITAMLDDIRAVQIESKTIVPENGLFLTCDNMNDMSLKPEGKVTVTNEDGELKEGIGAFKVTEAKDEIIRMNFYNKYDISSYQNGGLHMWLYIEDVTKLGAKLSIELGSGGKPDVEEYQWSVSKETLSNGWNEILLRFVDGVKIGGTPNLKAIDAMRIYSVGGQEVTVILDDVRAVLFEQEPERPPVQLENAFTQSSNYTYDGLGSAKPILGTTTVTEGGVPAGTVYAEVSGPTKSGQSLFKSTVGKKDLTGYTVNNSKICFMMYSDIEYTFESGTFDLSSAGTPDDSTINSNRRFWWFQEDKDRNLTIHKGWNRVELPLATMKQWGTFDLAKLDRIRFSCTNSVFAEGTIFKITDVKLVKDDAEIVLLTAQEVGKNIGEIISEDINYSETQAFIKNDAYRWDCNTTVFNKKVLSAYESFDDLALTFWMKSTTAKTVTLDSDTNIFWLTTEDNQIVTFKGEQIVLKANEWTKVTLPFSQSNIPKVVTPASNFVGMRFLLQGLEETTKIAISDIDIVKLK